MSFKRHSEAEAKLIFREFLAKVVSEDRIWILEADGAVAVLYREEGKSIPV